MRKSALLAALCFGSALVPSGLGAIAAKLGVLPRLSGGTPDVDFAVARTSANIPSIAVTPFGLNGYVRGFSADSKNLVASGDVTWNVGPTVAASCGNIVPGNLMRISPQSVVDANATAYMQGVVKSWDPVGNVLVVTVTSRQGSGATTYNSWALLWHLPVNASVSGSTTDGSFVVNISGTTAAQTVQDWDFTTSGCPLGFINGANGENGTITVTQCLFALQNVPTYAAMFGPKYTTQPYIITRNTIDFDPLAAALTANITADVTAHAATDVSLVTVSVDVIPPAVLAKPGNYAFVVKDHLDWTMGAPLSAASGTTITLANETNDFGILTPVLQTIPQNSTALFIPYVSPGAIATGACVEFSYNYVQSAGDFFFYVRGVDGKKTRVFGNIALLRGMGAGHSDLMQGYALNQGLGLDISNNFIKLAPLLAMQHNGNPRDLFVMHQEYAFTKPFEVHDNIFDLSNSGGICYFHTGLGLLSVTNMTNDSATGEIRVCWTPQQDSGYYNAGDPIMVSGFPAALGINSNTATVGTVYADFTTADLGIKYTANGTLKLSGAASVNDTTLNLVTTTGLCKGLVATFGSGSTLRTYTIADIDVANSRISITPAVSLAITNGTSFFVSPSFTIKNSAGANVTGYGPPSTITTSTSTLASASGGANKVLKFADTTGIVRGMVGSAGTKTGLNTTAGYNYYVDTIAGDGSVTFSRPIGIDVPAATSVTFQPAIRFQKTALSSFRDNYVVGAVTGLRIGFAATGATSGGKSILTVTYAGDPPGNFVYVNGPLAICVTMYNNRSLTRDSNTGLITGVDPTGLLQVTNTQADTYPATGSTVVGNVTGPTINPPCAAPTGVQAKFLAGDTTKATVTYTSGSGSMGEIYSLDGGATWSDTTVVGVGGRITSGTVVPRGTATSIMLMSMNTIDDINIPRNPSPASVAAAITA